MKRLLVALLGVLAIALPLGLMARHAVRGKPLPLISVTAMVANAVWWTALQYIQSFFWVATFHAVQYLSIVVIFHVRERLARPDNGRGWAFHALTFYAACVGLAYLLFSTPAAARASRWRGLRLVDACGRHSLEIFAAGCLAALIGRILYRTFDPTWPLQVAVNVGGIAVMLGLAHLLDARLRRAAETGPDARRPG